MTRIIAPSRLTLENAVDFANRITNLDYRRIFEFDFQRLMWVEPFGMLFVAQAMKNLQRRYSDSRLIAYINNENATSYASYMSFFTACGLEHGNNPGFRTSGTTYIPITYVLSKQLHSTNEIEAIAQGLAEQLAERSSGKLVDIFTYSFREIIRNVIEHSDSTVLGYCAQYWPKINRGELAILDIGVGLRKSLSQNPYLKLNDDSDAIKYALMPGISGKTYDGVKLRPNDVWQNSGYGLYMNYRFCNEGGDFFICSGEKGLLRNVNNHVNHYMDTNFQGTALRLCIDTSTLGDVGAMLQRFKNDGELVARRLGKGAVLTASTMSQMLRDNFKSIKINIEVGNTVRHQQFGEGIVEEKVVVPPYGEMLWVLFNNGRRKKIETKYLILVEQDVVTYSDDISENPSSNDDYHQDDSFFENF